jgi:biopolymer transport protein ExbD
MKQFDQINVIPFIDIMLVMLAIVLTTASFISTGLIEVDLPEAESASPPLDEDAVEIAIDANNVFYLREKVVTLALLSKGLKEIRKETPMVLRVDKAVRFESFVSVIDLLKKYQLEKLSIETKGVHAPS